MKEVEAPAKRTGKMSIREAVMNMNSAEMSSQYTSQMPSSHVADQKKRPEVNHPSFKGTLQPPSERAIKPANGNASQASALVNRMNAISANKEKQAAEEASSQSKQKDSDQPTGFGRFFHKKN